MQNAKWVDIKIKGIDAFMKGVDTYICAINARAKGELEVGSNASTLLIVPKSKLQVFTH